MLRPDPVPILELKNVTKCFKKFIAVEDVSFKVLQGEILGLIGESGSGKTTIAKLIVGLHRPDSGEIIIDELASKIQLIFQDPYSSLNPKLSIGTIIGEVIHRRCMNDNTKLSRKQIVEEAKEYLNIVGLPINILDNYPHQFSGGQRQRIAIARALALKPGLIIADEPLSQLDVSIQAQIINLFMELKEKYGLSYVFISHDLLVVNTLSDRILIIQNGRIVEENSPDRIFQTQSTDYTRRLVTSLPGFDL